MRKSNKKKAVVAGTILALGTAGAAYAYWSTTGTGTGTGATTAGVTDSLTFTQDALSAMHPGDSAQTLTVNVKNTAGENAYVSTVKAYVTTDKDGCTGDDFLLGGTAGHKSLATAKTLTWTGQDLAKTGGNDDATSTVQFNNTGADQDACKGAEVTLHYLAS